MDRTEELLKSVKFLNEDYVSLSDKTITPFVQMSIKISTSLDGNKVLVTKMEKLYTIHDYNEF